MALVIGIGDDGRLHEFSREAGERASEKARRERELEQQAQELADLSDAAIKGGTVPELARMLASQSAARYETLAELARERGDRNRELEIRRGLDRMRARAAQRAM